MKGPGRRRCAVIEGLSWEEPWPDTDSGTADLGTPAGPGRPNRPPSREAAESATAKIGRGNPRASLLLALHLPLKRGDLLVAEERRLGVQRLAGLGTLVEVAELAQPVSRFLGRKSSIRGNFRGPPVMPRGVRLRSRASSSTQKSSAVTARALRRLAAWRIRRSVETTERVLGDGVLGDQFFDPLVGVLVIDRVNDGDSLMSRLRGRESLAQSMRRRRPSSGRRRADRERGPGR